MINPFRPSRRQAASVMTCPFSPMHSSCGSCSVMPLSTGLRPSRERRASANGTRCEARAPASVTVSRLFLTRCFNVIKVNSSANIAALTPDVTRSSETNGTASPPSLSTRRVLNSLSSRCVSTTLLDSKAWLNNVALSAAPRRRTVSPSNERISAAITSSDMWAKTSPASRNGTFAWLSLRYGACR